MFCVNHGRKQLMTMMMGPRARAISFPSGWRGSFFFHEQAKNEKELRIIPAS